jgi:hypothetical protein
MLYRSEQPTALRHEEPREARASHGHQPARVQRRRDEVKGTSLRTERIKILTWRIGDSTSSKSCACSGQTENGPFLIHCQHGADRTGLMSAMYRILEQGWTPEDALKELIDGGYGYHSMWKNIVRYVRSATSRKLRLAIARRARTSTVTDNL